MFWKFNLLTSSHVDTLLEKEDVTLRELMDEDDILQECKAQNRKLIDFLIQPENMEDMVKMITKEPEDDVEEKLRFKYPNTACELLTSDVSQINDKLASDKELVDQLYSFLESEKPLNPLLASFFSKVMGLLITRKSEMIFEYLKAQKDFVGSLLHHIGTSAIMDLLLRLITCIESPETRRAVIEWLNECQIVQRLVDCIVPSSDEDIHCNAAQSLCDIVRLGREQMMQMQDTSDPDPLLTTMELEETVSKLLNNMFELEQNESVIVNGLFVIHTLLEVRKQGQEGLNDQMAAIDTDRLSQGINNVMAAIIPRLKNFHNLLVNPPKQKYSRMPTSVGTLEPPLGNARLQVAKLITALVATNMPSVNTELVNLNTLQALLDLYFKYSWNNFLHTQVEQCVVLVLNNPPVESDGATQQPLLKQLFVDVRLPQRLLEEWEENDQQQNKEGGKRKGFMGHLTKMANALTLSKERGCNTDLIKDYWAELPEECKQKWDAFVLGTLTDINKKNTVEFRGHPLASSSEDDDADFKDIPFPQDTAMQQAFSDYQLQQMTSNFIDQFGFNEEDFAEQEEKIDEPFSHRISSINFNLQADEVTQPNNTMFDQACNDRIQQFDEDDSDEDIWVEKPLTFDKNAQHMRSGRLQGQTARANSSDDSTDSEEELDSPHSIPQQATPLSTPSPVSSAAAASGTPPSATSTPVPTSSVTIPTVMAAAAEKMDVDFSEGPWPANGENSSHAEPTEMETNSPWEGAAPPPAAPREGWASFEKPQASAADNWADFSSFSDMSSRTGNGPRSSSPVAMDTSEASKGNAYVISDDSAVPESSSSGSIENKDRPQASGSGDMKVESLELADEPLPDSTSPPVSSLSPPVQSDAVSTTPSTSEPPPSSTDVTVSSTSSEAESPKPAQGEVNMEPKESPVASSASDGVVVPTPNPMAVDSSTAASSTPQQNAELSNEAKSNKQDDDDNDDDELGANFDFLTASGLMCKSPGAAGKDKAKTGAGDQGQAGMEAAQEPDTTNSLDLEAARAQAKEMMERYDAATVPSSESTVHNGPV
ncbi:serine/threonine-protein phosphatase 6 regulatory subunit 3-like isoform X3 [Littorina saxatilis]|uniref:serine/threonine-protein phosphatase 6 regulatory subunit 3-like isoform X3 n=1 Tax=Littorina saxatilis TaxID=31220 RepID=UPI0038B60076